MANKIPTNHRNQQITFAELIDDIIREQRFKDIVRKPLALELPETTEQKPVPLAEQYPLIASLFSKSFPKDGVYKCTRREQHTNETVDQILLEFDYIPLRGSLSTFTNHFKRDSKFIVSAIFKGQNLVYLCDGYSETEDEAKAIALSGLKDMIFLDPAYHKLKKNFHRSFFDNAFWNSPYHSHLQF